LKSFPVAVAEHFVRRFRLATSVYRKTAACCSPDSPRRCSRC
jgi:hypothetical protein